MATWKAASDRVLVQVNEKPKQTVGGIVLPEKAKADKVQYGTVLAVGPLAQGVLPGDSVAFQSSGAHEVGLNVASLNVDYILAITREE